MIKSSRIETLSPLAARSCSQDGSSNSNSSDEGEGGGFSDSAEFIRNRKERSTVLVRRFFKNNQKVSVFIEHFQI